MTELNDVFTEIDTAIKEDPSVIDGLNATYQFNLGDEGTYQLILNGADSYSTEGEKEDADCTMTMKAADFIKMSTGDLNGTQAFMTGRLKVKGNMGLALKLQSLLSEFNKAKKRSEEHTSELQSRGHLV